uniref:Uncharacterized protein n=1 Tax=Phakopsora pachyrhizi TaxID=170000 RepID=A0A0S1MI96_PHAPC
MKFFLGLTNLFLIASIVGVVFSSPVNTNGEDTRLQKRKTVAPATCTRGGRVVKNKCKV